MYLFYQVSKQPSELRKSGGKKLIQLKLGFLFVFAMSGIAYQSFAFVVALITSEISRFIFRCFLFCDYQVSVISWSSRRLNLIHFAIGVATIPKLCVWAISHSFVLSETDTICRVYVNTESNRFKNERKNFEYNINKSPCFLVAIKIN